MRILRAILIALIVIVVGIPVISYVMLSTDWVQIRLRNAGEEALVRLVGTESAVGSVSYSPFNRLSLEKVVINDDNGVAAVSIDEIIVRAELMELLLRQRIIIDYVVVDGLNGSLYRSEPGAPLNIAGILRRLKSDKPKKEPSPFSLSLNDVEVLNSAISYKVLSDDTVQGRFSANHIELSDLNLAVYAPKISNDGYEFDLRRLSFCEKSGFCLSGMSAKVAISPTVISVEKLKVMLPGTSLMFADFKADIDGYSDLGALAMRRPVEVGLLPSSVVSLSDFSSFVPALAEFSAPIDLSFSISGMLSDFKVDNFKAGIDGATIGMRGDVTGLPERDDISVKDLHLNVHAMGPKINRLLASVGVKVPSMAMTVLENAGETDVVATLGGTLNRGVATVEMYTDCGSAEVSGSYARNGKAWNLDAEVSTNDLMLGDLLSHPDLGIANVSADISGSLTGKNFIGKANCQIDELGLKGYDYHGVKLKADLGADDATLYADSNDPNLQFMLQSQVRKTPAGRYAGSIVLQLVRADLDAIGLWSKYPGHALKATVLSEADFMSFSDFNGYVTLSNVQYLDSASTGLRVRKFGVTAENTPDFGYVNIASDFLNGDIQGKINPATIGDACARLADKIFPAIAYVPVAPEAAPADTLLNDFVFDFTAENAENVCRFFGLPISVLDPVAISGEFDEGAEKAVVSVDAEWLMQSDKLVKDTGVTVSVDGKEGDAAVYVTTHYPTKKGPMNLIADVHGRGGRFATNIDWDIERDIPINGNIKFDTYFTHLAGAPLAIDVNIDPGTINFGNEVWTIRPSKIRYSDKSLSVDGFALEAPTQKIKIYGSGSESAADVITVDLKGIRLLEIFETLEIDKALLCGEATGQITVSSLFSKTPDVRSRKFFVKGMGYNRCVLGDADIKLGLDNETSSFWFDALLTQADGRHSTIKGSITPATEELDFLFDADHVRIGFMQPFMEAFCSNIDGYATGKAHLFGTFKYIDLTSENLVADSLRMKIDFTNTWYSAADARLNITPGNIAFDDVTIYDDQGHHALLSGYVKHEFFKKPVFKFGVREARDFLCYDMPKGANARWWGTIYGNGRADIDGRPGEVNIGVNMTTCPGSKFTFALTDELEAVEYSFISFNDVTPEVKAEAFYDMQVESKSIKKAESLKSSDDEESPTAYNMDIQVDVTPSALVTLVMDPVGGDEIKAHGSGNLRMYYGSASDILTLNGEYVLDSGDYNFTLQDIIIKEFKIRPGSSIKFTGDPYAATLDIDAIYQTTANLSDLDESFLSDKDLNRTNIVVNAVMLVTGNMLQPDIKFDLEFPTLTDDVVSRKVHSIVSTDDMMNRQIIYLLALNRFYTPEYMASTTKGNELFSVASSTLSSQLSSMLGKLSDNWSIAPNLRSNQGDFSDVEVDVNLSSRLLNNRLLFNGNFGYRDKSLNTNQFIGDFDVEYLLNHAGTLRFKAYNRYNDQNFYVRTAQTTQGIGVMVRKDFDNLLDLFGRKKKKAPVTEVIDSTVIYENGDSIIENDDFLIIREKK